MKLIVEMEMPHSCFDCPCHNGEGGYYCQVDKHHRYIYNDIPPWCPIVGVLPDEHGDLIDRDYLRKYGMMYRDGIDEGGLIYVPLRDVTKSISNAPTVIAAERKDDGTTVD